MSLYLYGVVSADGPPFELPAGVGGGKPVLHRLGGLAAIVSPLDAEAVVARKRDLQAHEQVLRAALEARDPVLPLRFGSVYRDAAALEEYLLEPAGEELHALLERFAGLVELELRALYADADGLLRELVAGDPTLLRLSRRARRGGYGEQIDLGEAVVGAYRQRRAADEQRLVRRLTPLAHELGAREGVPEQVAAQVAFLVERGRVAAFEQEAERLAAEERPALRLTLLGPLPPYSFLSFELAEAVPAA